MTDMQKQEAKREQARIRQQRHRARKRETLPLAPCPMPPASKAPRLSGSQITTTAQGPMTPWFKEYVFRKVDGNFYEALREGIPLFDAAIRRLITLNGSIKIIGDNMSCVRELEDFSLNVPVNDMQKGIHAFKENAENETFEQGFSISEFVANKKRDDIERIMVADSKQIVFRRNSDGRIEPWIRQGTPITSGYTMPSQIIQDIMSVRYGGTVSYNGVEETRLNPDNKLYFSINNENQNPYGVSLFRSTEFVAQVRVTIQNSFKNIAERYGDPSFHVHYKGKSGEAGLEARRKTLETDFSTMIAAKRGGKSGDLVTAGGPDSDVVIKVIGHDGQIYDFAVPIRVITEECVAKFGLPAWMLGIYWSSTERMATLEVEMALADAKIRQAAMLPEYLRLFSDFLRLRGKSWSRITTSVDKPGDWGIVFESPNVRDLVAQAQAEFLSAQAGQMRRYGTSAPAASPTPPVTPTTPPVEEGASIEINGMRFPLLNPAKTAEGRAQSAEGKALSSLSPARERAEGEGADSKSDICSCGQRHAPSAMRHAAAKELSRPIPWPELDEWEQKYEQNLKDDWQLLQEKVFDILGLKVPDVSSESGVRSSETQNSKLPTPNSQLSKAFEFSDVQRKAILKALADYLGWYDPKNDDSSIAWYYGQSYSLGLIQAAQMLGKERPILDILQNQDIYADLTANGFQLVKDHATQAIRNDIITAMENGVTQGVNPRDMASTLAGMFDDKNSDWERLARTEMAGAAESAKLAEWKERGVDVSNVYNSSVGGAIVPVHPRCRCSTTVKDDGNGNFRAAFLPAPDACPWCLSMQEGDKRQGQGSRVKGQGEAGDISELVGAVKAIADRPINIKIEQAPVQMHLDMELRTPDQPPKKQKGTMTKSKDGKLEFELTEVKDVNLKG